MTADEPGHVADTAPLHLRRSPLAAFADRFARTAEMADSPVHLREVPFLSQLDLRVDPVHGGVLAAAAEVLGFPLPVEPNTVRGAGGRSALWLGPDEWLVVAPPERAGPLETALRSALGGGRGAVVDVSANRTCLALGGPRARDVLATGCRLDLHPRAFGPGRCAQSTVAQAAVILEQLDRAPTYRLFVRPSFAAYLAEWLLLAMAAYLEGDRAGTLEERA